MKETNEIKLDEEEFFEKPAEINEELLKKEAEDQLNILTKKYNTVQNISNDTIMVAKFDEVGGHVTYIIKGTIFEKEIKRRFKEFFAFYEKLKQKWPGIYIPPISKKQVFSNLDIETLKKRKNQLDNFVKELYKITYLYESEESKIFFSPEYGEDTNNDVIKALNKLPIYTKSEMRDNYEKKIQPFYADLKKKDFNDEQYQYCMQYIDNFLNKLTQYKEMCIKISSEKEEMIKNSSETLQSYENFEKLAVSEFIENNNSKLIFFNASNFKLNQALLDFKKGMKNPYQVLASWVRQKEIELLSMKESLNKYNKLFSEKQSLINDLHSIENKINDLNQGKKGFFATITMQDPEKLKEKYNSEKTAKENDIADMEKMIEILKDYYSFYIYDFFKLLKISLYDLMKNFADCNLSNCIKISEFWLKVQVEENQINN